MENSMDKIIESLNHLIAIANDGKCGYENAAKDVKDLTLKELFTQYSSERASMVQELKNEVKNLGGDPEKNGDNLGALHRAWMDITAGVTSGDRADVLRSCITGEEAALKAFNEELANAQTNEINRLLSQQLNTINLALNNLRSLELAVTSG